MNRNLADWSALIAALSALIAALVAAVAVILDGRRSRFALSVDLIIRLSDRFDSGQFREIRRKAARSIKNGFLDENAEDVLDFFDTLGLFVRRGPLDKEAVWSLFYYWVYNYWHAAKDISTTVENDPPIWSDFKYLYKTVCSVERRASRRWCSPELKPTEADAKEFLYGEERLDTDNSSTPPASEPDTEPAPNPGASSGRLTPQP